MVGTRAHRVGLLLAVGCGLAAACGYPDADGETPSLLPERAVAKPDASYDAAVPEDEDASTTDAGATDAAPPPPELCNVADLALCLPFEGSVTDGSPNKLAVTAANVSFGAGKDGQGAVLGGASSIAIGPSPLFDGPAATIEAWVKPSAAMLTDGVVFDADGRFSLTITAKREVLCKSSGGAVSTGAIAAEQWAHVACTVGDGQLHVYVDGVDRGTGLGSITPNAMLGEAVGNNAPSGENLVGTLDSVRIFRVARTAADIAAAAKP